jgi:hypothetical protein
MQLKERFVSWSKRGIAQLRNFNANIINISIAKKNITKTNITSADGKVGLTT